MMPVGLLTLIVAQGGADRAPVNFHGHHRPPPLRCTLSATTLNGPKARHSQGRELTTEQIAAKARPRVVTVVAGDNSGTGFIVDGYLYTCYHVVAGADSIRYFNPPIDARVTRATTLSPAADLAVFDLGQDIDPEIKGVLHLASFHEHGKADLEFGDYAALPVGSRLVVVGSPRGLDGTVTEGLCSAKRSTGSRQLLQLSAGVSPGSSGSPVLNKFGQVVGMVTSMLTDGQELNFALAASQIKRDAFTGVPLALSAGDQLSGVKYWTPDEVRAWTGEAQTWLAEARSLSGVIDTSSWDLGSPALTTAMAQFVHANSKLIARTAQVVAKMNREPEFVGNWFHAFDCITNDSERLADIAHLSDVSAYHTTISDDIAATLFKLSTSGLSMATKLRDHLNAALRTGSQ